jgi:predicted permease
MMINFFAQLWRRLRYYWRRSEFDRDLQEEMRFHLQMRIEENLAAGMAAEEASNAARRQFGNQTWLREESREMWNFRSIEKLFQDVRFGLRMMRKTPGFTAIAVLSLALGIGANTAIFSLIDAVMLKTLPVKDPGSLVLFNWEAGRVFRTNGMRGTFIGGYAPDRRGGNAFPVYIAEKLRAEQSDDPSSALSDLFAFAWLGNVSVLADGQAETAGGQVVSGNYFAGLGVPPLLGRMIADADDDASSAPVAVLSHRYWQERFGADPAIIGKQIQVNQNAFTIIGVTPPAFNGALQVDERPAITMPLAFEPVLESQKSMIDKPGRLGPWWLLLMGRLKPQATIEQAQASLDGTFQSLALERMPPPRKANEAAQIEPKDYPHLVGLSGSRGMWEMRSVYSSTLYLMLGVVGLILLIACANVANLLLARAALRASEITMRLAVGAGRWRVIRQLLTESILLAGMGGAVGVLFALWGKEALVTLSGRQGGFLPPQIDATLNWRVLGFTVGVVFLTGIVFGLVPAWRATRLDLTTALKESNRSSSGVARSRLSKTLVIAQVTMSLVLLVGAGLFIRTLRNLQQVDIGFSQENLLVFSLQPGANGYKDERLVQLYQQMFARLETIPGVRSATFAHIPLLAHNVDNTSLILPGETAQSESEHITNREIVRENYFATMEIPLLRGRGFTAHDDKNAPRVAIISETLARKFFPDDDPIGKRVGYDNKTAGQIEIIGIARDIKYNTQRDEGTPLIYLHWLQEPEDINWMFFSLKAAGDPLSLTSAMRQAVREVDNHLPIIDINTQAAQASEALSEERLFASLLSFFGVLALVLATVGLYGVMAYSVAQRTHEIGIRMALGAQTGNVLRLVIWQGMKLVLIGLAAGALAAFALKQIIASQLYGVQATDPLTFTLVGVLLVIIALLACWIPARRATKVDPMVALRYE